MTWLPGVKPQPVAVTSVPSGPKVGVSVTGMLGLHAGGGPGVGVLVGVGVGVGGGGMAVTANSAVSNRWTQPGHDCVKSTW
jgi:hypothetical protein